MDETESASEQSISVAPGVLTQDEPRILVRPPGPQSRTWLTRATRASAPMGPPRLPEIGSGVQADVAPGSIVYALASGSNVFDVDGNRYVDLAAGFGAQLLGHAHPFVRHVLELQLSRLWQALGDVYPADAKIALCERLAKLHPSGAGQVILGLSGADAVSAALKSAALFTARAGVLAFHGSYHGLSYGPLAVSSLRESYRAPFLAQLNPHVEFIDYPSDAASCERALSEARDKLASGAFGALIVEPILGRAGCVVPPDGFLRELGRLARAASALTIADEIWTGLGRSGRMTCGAELEPDIVCLGKGLGGGLPVSACIGSQEVMAAWSRDAEVVHTSTFAGAPLSAAAALATLDVLGREKLVERSAELGERLIQSLRGVASELAVPVEVRGQGLMIGLDLTHVPGGASRLQRALLERGYITSSGGGARDVLVLTPPLTIAEPLLDGFCLALAATLRGILA